MALFLQKLGCRCEITALKFVHQGRYLLSGEGSFLSVYDTGNGACIGRYGCLESNKIHGIRSFELVKNEYIVVCFGHREMNIVTFNSSTCKIEPFLENGMMVRDWILDCRLLNSTENNNNINQNELHYELAVGLMHNQVLLYTLDIEINDSNNPSKNSTVSTRGNVSTSSGSSSSLSTSSQSSRILKSNSLIRLSKIDYVMTIENEKSSLLYCLSFHGDNRDSLVVAAGDCFNHLLIWQVFDSRNKDKKTKQQETTTTPSTVHKAKVKFRGRRKGVLYSIKWSENGKFLCVASDDRSVQLWQFINSQQLTVVYSVFGHTSRVLDCWISPNGQYAISISEDSTCRVWNQMGDTIDCFELGKSGQIWSLDAVLIQSKGGNDQYYIALGGCDASIRLHYFFSPKMRKHKSSDNNENKTDNDDSVITDAFSIDLKKFEEQEDKENEKGDFDKKNDLFGSMKHYSDCNVFKYLEFPSSVTKLLANKSNDQHKKHVSSSSFDDNLIDAEEMRSGGKKKKRGRNRKRSSKTGLSTRSSTTIRNMVINCQQEIYFATANDIFCVSNLNSKNRNKNDNTVWKHIAGFGDDNKSNSNDSVTTNDKSSNSNHNKKEITTMILMSKDRNHLKQNIFERWLIVGDRGGTITIIDVKNEGKITFAFRAHDIGIISIYAYIDDETNDGNLLLFTSDGHGNISSWQFKLQDLLSDNMMQNIQDGKPIVPIATFLNPNKKQISAYCYDNNEKLLIAGDARGNVVVFDMNENELKNGKKMHKKPIQSLKNVHGREPVCCIKLETNEQSMSVSTMKNMCKDEKNDDDNKKNENDDNKNMNSNISKNKKRVRVISGGKDGKLVEYELLEREKKSDINDSNEMKENDTSVIDMLLQQDVVSDSVVLKMIGEISSLSGTKMSSIDSIMFLDNNKIIICGFHSNYFIVWDMIEDYILFRWNCGGLKRPHFFSFYNNLYNFRGWLFGYTNSNFENGIALVNVNFDENIQEMYLGSLAIPYHGSEIHELQWFLHPSIMNNSKVSLQRREKIVANFDDNDKKSNENENNLNDKTVFGDILDGLLLASSGEDGSIQTITPQFSKQWYQRVTSKLMPWDLRRRNSDRMDKLASITSIGSIGSLTTTVSSVVDDINDEALNIPVVTLRNDRKLSLSQSGNKRLPFKCSDLVRKWDNSGYLLFAAGAKEFLQAFELSSVSVSSDSDERVCKWRALCWTGGDSMKHSGKTWKKSDKMMEERLSKMDLRIKSLVVIPHPKYYDKWLVVTGNSVGTIRAYTIDEVQPREFQFEGEDNLLHRESSNKSRKMDRHSGGVGGRAGGVGVGGEIGKSRGGNNDGDKGHTRPILSLTSTFCCEKNYDWHFEANPENEERSQKWDKKDVSKRIIPSYTDRAPHLIFSGSTDGWIRIWFWDVDIHSIVVIDKIALHQSGVNSISVTWMDEQFIPKIKVQTQIMHEKERKKNVAAAAVGGGSSSSPRSAFESGGLVTRRLAMVSVGDDQAMSLIIADFESLISANMAAKQRRIYHNPNNLQHGKHSSFIEQSESMMALGTNTGGGWKLSVVQEMMESTCHSASVRDVSVIAINDTSSKMEPIDTYIEKNERNTNTNTNTNKNANTNTNINKSKNKKYSRFNDLIIVTTGDDQRVRLWGYRFNAFDNVALLDQITSDVGLVSSLTTLLIRNYGLLVAVAGQGLQMFCLPLSSSSLSSNTHERWIKKWSDNANNENDNSHEKHQSSSFRRFSQSSINMSQIDSESESVFSTEN